MHASSQSSSPALRFTIHADGACKGNPGPGGWGVVLDASDGSRRFLNGYASETTNNRMELTALIQALLATPVGSEIHAVTDSQYAKQGITEWIHGWKRKNWRSSTGAPVKNTDLWQALDLAASQRRVRWSWVRGHNGHELNEMADALANEAVAAKRSTRSGSAHGH